MSLEAQLAELNTNITALIGILSSGAAITAPAQAEAPAAEVKPAKASKKAAEPKPEPVAEEAELEPEAPKAVTYQEVAAAVVALAKGKGRAAAETLLGKWNASNLQQVPPSELGAVLAAAQEALA